MHEDIADYHNEEASAHRYQWIQITMTIMSAALALLASTSGKVDGLSCLSIWLLRFLYLLFGSTLIVGALALHGRVRAHIKARDRVVDDSRKTNPDMERDLFHHN